MAEEIKTEETESEKSDQIPRVAALRRNRGRVLPRQCACILLRFSTITFCLARWLVT